ncbi:hypothetical protein [Cesiribacter andamanensis]|uniref:Uncharacterized protein n=1 Tax=Cesiribacter andamanensis AMV16 TaxID=1279009 RepID=M7NZT3_9BACT|nr:hypothetical protein [Cesiribacter andamanensis]EMR03864.1 hypothetical protein ADICEAN_01013 [Cesiribacter andamanensis AMV16]
MKKYLFFLSLALVALISQGHIGSPGVTLEGSAGPYRLTVLVSPPEVIPGTATVDVYLQAEGTEAIFLKPIYWYAGGEGTPRADEALPVAGEPGHYQGQIWLMNGGTSSLEVEVVGSQGEGKLLVPVMAVSTAQNSMDPSLGWVLAGLALFLVILMVTIISASSSDGLVKPGAPVPSNLRRKRWVGAIAGFVVLSLMLWGGKSWWDSWASNYQRFLYKPFQAQTTVEDAGDRQLMRFQIDSGRINTLYLTRRLSYLMPDHGKLMHTFLIRSGSLDVFAHLHPQRRDTLTFESVLPPLPAGRYLLFSDITRLSGFSETIPDTVDIPAPSEALLAAWSDSLLMDRDDTYYVTSAITPSSQQAKLPGSDIIVCGSPGMQTTLADGSTATWELPKEQKFLAGKLYSLTFAIQDPEGKPAQLEPYLGMMGHAVVFKEDASVYIHLHPVGTYSMASQQTMLARFQNESGPVQWDKLPKPQVFADSIDRMVASLNALPAAEREKRLMGDMEHGSLSDPEHPEHAVVSFPYSFPSAGRYRVYLQMKREGKILNSAFDVTVE